MTGDDRRSRERRAEGTSSARRSRPSLHELVENGEISDAELEERARETLLRVLTAAPKSRVELAQSLGRKGYPERVVGPLLDRFEEVGLVDDASYAEMLVRTRHGERSLSRRAIAAELRRRGIDEETSASALDQVDDDSEADAARDLARARLRRTAGLDRDVRIRRAVGALARKGYSPSLAFEVVQRELDEEPSLDD
nr:regulatory protein RecX [Cellulosimicrobium cellulans]